MIPPIQLPLRVLIKGPSTVLYTSWMGGPRTDMVFSRVMEQQLLAGGRAAEVRNTGELGWPTKDLFKTWPEDIVQWSPDIVVMAVGHYETLHAILPRWLERLANREGRRPSVFQNLYYRIFARSVARVVMYLQRNVDRPGLRRRRRIRRVIKDTAAYIKITERFGSPLFLILEIHTPTAAKRDTWFPGWPQRIKHLNDDLRQLVAELDSPDVRFVEITDMMDRFDDPTAEGLWPDGIHFIPEFHRAVGERLAGIAEEWASGQSHLAKP